MRKHPIQNVEDDGGSLRFVENKIVSFLLDQYKPGLNDIAIRFHGEEHLEDYDQLMQLIGYSLDGFWEIASGSERVMRKTLVAADRKKVIKHTKGI